VVRKVEVDEAFSVDTADDEEEEEEEDITTIEKLNILLVETPSEEAI